jgi:hypothetical protein
MRPSVPEIYTRSSSTGWITPDGVFEPLGSDSIHDDLVRYLLKGRQLPEADKFYPSRGAVNMGFAKVSNPCTISLDKIRNNDLRLKTMAGFAAEAIIAFDKSETVPDWLKTSYRHQSPLIWPVTIYTRNGSDETPRHVDELIFSYGSTETKALVKAHFKMNESVIRKLIRRILAG